MASSRAATGGAQSRMMHRGGRGVASGAAAVAATAVMGRRVDASVGGARGRGRLVVAASQVITGVVVSTKMDKTAVVEVARKTAHPKYKKVVRRTKKYLAHDEENECKEGYLVTVEPVGRKCGF